MSAIFGVVYFDGRPVSLDAIEHLRRAHDPWGWDRRGVWRDGPAALGAALQCSTPESRSEIVPMVDAAAGTAMVTIARLDNRDELCDAFDVPAARRTSTPDGQLVRPSRVLARGLLAGVFLARADRRSVTQESAVGSLADP